MDENAFKKYLTEDYPKAVKFYDDRATTSKRYYRILSVYLIIVSAGLTLVVAFGPKDDCWRIVGSLLSVSLVIATGLLAHFKCHENWLSYRGSWDALERERRMYATGVGEYKTATDKDALFVERVEALLAREGADFYARHPKGEEQAKKPDTTK